MKGYSAFPKAPALLKPHHHNRTLVGGGSYPSAEKQSVYSTAPANWARMQTDQLKLLTLPVIYYYSYSYHYSYYYYYYYYYYYHHYDHS